MAGVRGVAAAAFAAALIAAACAADPPSLDSACDKAVRVFRARRAACFGFPPMPADEERLIERGTRECTLYWGAAGSRVDSAYWEKCAAAAEGNCGDPTACDSYPYGARATGQPCLSFAQCASLWCSGVRVIGPDGKRSPRAVQCGTCAAQLPEGTPCNVETDACQAGQPGTSCFRGVCRRRGAEGAACDVSNDCNTPWICTSAGTCGPAVPEGGSCVASIECAGEWVCDPTTKTCVGQEYAQPGGACDIDIRGCWTGACDMADGATVGVCPIVLPDGSPCDANDHARTCDSYAACFQGTCQIPDPAACG